MASTGGGVAVVGEPDDCEVFLTVDTIEDNENTYTRKVIKYSRSIFETYCEQNHISAACGGKQEVFATLDGVLAKFYVEARNRGGKLYSKKTMQAVRFGLQRHFASLYEIDITRHPAFFHSNSVYKHVLKGLKTAGKANVKHRPQITSDDIIRIQTSLQAKQSTAKGLQQKVFLDIVVHFNDLRVSNFRGLKRGDFQCHSGAGSGQKFYTLGAGVSARHHKPPEYYEQSRMYSVPDNKNCPVASLQRYLAKLNPTCEFLWQRPRTIVNEEQAVWYDNTPLGKETLRTMMKTISLEANCSTAYTFHCLRASSFSMLQYYRTKGKEIEGTEDAVQYDIDEDDDDDDDDDGWEMDFGKEDNTDDATKDATFPSDVTPSPVHESKEFLETFIDSSSKNGPEMHKEPEKKTCGQASIGLQL
ncbi:uncharacterized protein [Diadema setosum]|uniref:uncharacterized protein n=1 Tax=Diadema setosum TaxID=31175 RepID=UPI003B3A9A9E